MDRKVKVNNLLFLVAGFLKKIHIENLHKI